MEKRLWIVIGVLVIVATFWCSALGDEVVYRNDFSEGDYTLTLEEDYRVKWRWFGFDGEIEDFKFEAAGRCNPNSSDVMWGLIWGTDNDNYYLFWISPDGTYKLERQGFGSWQRSDSWQKSRSIVCGTGINTLMVSVEDEEIELYVNGDLIYTRGTTIEGPWDFAVAVGTYDTDFAQVHIDWVEIRELD